jgi:DNA-binding MarR family transcriptional regulator
MEQEPGGAGEVVGLLFQVLGLVRHRMVEAIGELGITHQQAHALRRLDPEHPLPMRDLAADLMCDASTVTGLVDRLEERGLVRRQADAVDRRVKALVVTDSGAALRERLKEVMSSDPHLLALSERELAQLTGLLRKIVGSAGVELGRKLGEPVQDAGGAPLVH